MFQERWLINKNKNEGLISKRLIRFFCLKNHRTGGWWITTAGAGRGTKRLTEKGMVEKGKQSKRKDQSLSPVPNLFFSYFFRL